MDSDGEGHFVCGERSEDSKSFGSLEDFIVEDDDEQKSSCSQDESHEETDDDPGLDESNMFDSTKIENGTRRSTRKRKIVERYIDADAVALLLEDELEASAEDLSLDGSGENYRTDDDDEDYVNESSDYLDDDDSYSSE